MNIASLTSSFLPGKLAGDVSFLLLFVVGSFALSFLLGRTRLVSVVMFSYVAFAFVGALPAVMFSFSLEGKAIVFLGLLIFLVVVGEYILDIHISNPTSKFFSRGFVMGCLATGLVLSMLLSFVSHSLSLQFISSTVSRYFSDPWARVAWMVMPLIFLLFINKRRR